MIILTIRTDSPEAEIGVYDGELQLGYKKWPAHRQLAETLHASIEELLESVNKDWQNIEGVAYYQGPGSFTGLRIGAATANALSLSLGVPILAGSGNDWKQQIVAALLAGENHHNVVPEYGSEPHITSPRK